MLGTVAQRRQTVRIAGVPAYDRAMPLGAASDGAAEGGFRICAGGEHERVSPAGVPLDRIEACLELLRRTADADDHDRPFGSRKTLRDRKIVASLAPKLPPGGYAARKPEMAHELVKAPSRHRSRRGNPAQQSRKASRSRKSRPAPDQDGSLLSIGWPGCSTSRRASATPRRAAPPPARAPSRWRDARASPPRPLRKERRGRCPARDRGSVVASRRRSSPAAAGVQLQGGRLAAQPNRLPGARYERQTSERSRSAPRRPRPRRRAFGARCARPRPCCGKAQTRSWRARSAGRDCARNHAPRRRSRGSAGRGRHGCASAARSSPRRNSPSARDR